MTHWGQWHHDVKRHHRRNARDGGTSGRLADDLAQRPREGLTLARALAIASRKTLGVSLSGKGGGAAGANRSTEASLRAAWSSGSGNIQSGNILLLAIRIVSQRRPAKPNELSRSA